MQISVYNQKAEQGKRIRLIVLFLLLLAQSLIITYFSSQTASQSAGLSRNIMNKLEWIPESIPREPEVNTNPAFSLHYFIRKLAHFYNFFIVGSILYASRYYMGKGVVKDILWLSVGLAIGILDEFHQRFVSGRSAEIIDVCVDFSGVIFGYIFIYIMFLMLFVKRCIPWKK